MTAFGFVPVTIDVRDQLLIPSDGAAVSPTTQDMIPGTRLRGVLAQRAAEVDRALIDVVIASGDVEAGTAFPLLPTGVVGYPAPVTALSSDTAPGSDTPDADRTVYVLDERGPLPNTARLQRISGLVARDGLNWVPVSVATVTAQRLARRRGGGDQSGMGPMTFTALAPQQRFRGWLRLCGDEKHQRELAQRIGELLDGQVIPMGSGEQNAYGGDPLWHIGAWQHSPPDLAPAGALRAAGEVDIVLRTPALVTHPDTGLYSPDALGHCVQALLNRVGVTGQVTAVSVRRVAVAGATVGYGRMRPQQWAAAAGSVVRVRVDEPSAGWATAAAQRLGVRTVDGFGALGVDVPVPAGQALLQPAQRAAVPPVAGSVVLAAGPIQAVPDLAGLTGLAGAQRDLLQRRLFDGATAAWRLAALNEVYASRSGFAGIPGSVWGRLRDAATDLDTWRELMARINEETGSPLAQHLAAAKIGPVRLTQWLTAAANGDATGIWKEVLPKQQRDWVNALKVVCLEQQPPGSGRPPQMLVAWIQSQFISEGQAIARGVLHAAQQAAAS